MFPVDIAITIARNLAKIIDTKILQFKFLRSLPDAIRISLAYQTDKTLPELVKIADCIHEQTRKTVLGINNTGSSDIIDATEDQSETSIFSKTEYN